MSGTTRNPEGNTTRRAILAATLGGVGAWVAGALGRAAPVAAADGDVVNVGDNLTGTKTTVFNVSTAGFSALWGNSTAATGGSVGVRGDTASSSSDAAGVLGNGVVDGVRGTGVRGVRGIGSSIGVEGVAQGGIAVLGSTTSGKGVQGNSSTSTGVEGGSASGPGVHGLSQNGIGVVGRQWNHGTGVAGFSLGSIETILTGKAKTGVYGEALQDSASRGVWGRSGAGQGTRGEATSGIGVYGIASTGYAFRGSGRLRFDKVSGVATIPAGSTSVTITPGVDINSASFVLLTSKTNLSSRSLYYSTDATNNRFTIRLSSSRTSSTVVAWLLVG